MSIYVTGDTHIPMDIKKLNTRRFPEQKEMTSEDYVCIMGDFGGVFYCDKEEEYWLDWLNNKNFTTLFIDGNHENFKALEEYPETIWNGGKVKFIREKVIYLMRGQVFNINGKSIFTMGGATSIDKEDRDLGIDFWEEELPSYEEIEEGVYNLEKVGNKVDFIFTHTTCNSILNELGYTGYDRLTDFLSYVDAFVDFKHWYCGHFHRYIKVDDKHTLVYEQIIKID